MAVEIPLRMLLWNSVCRHILHTYIHGLDNLSLTQSYFTTPVSADANVSTLCLRKDWNIFDKELHDL